MGDVLRFDAERLRILVERHHLHTGSARARELLEDWDRALPCFVKVMREYGVTDPALQLMGEVIAKGIDYVLHDFRPGPDDRYGQMGVGLASFADGMMITEAGDRARLDASYVVWDAMYALLKANTAKCSDKPYLRTRECGAV